MRKPPPGFYYGLAGVPLMYAGDVGADLFHLSYAGKAITFVLCVFMTFALIILGSVKELRAEATVKTEEGYWRRMIALYGMLGCGLGFSGFATSYFWPSYEEKSAGTATKPDKKETLPTAPPPMNRYRNEGELLPGSWPNPDLSDLPGPIPAGGFVVKYGNSLAVSFGLPLCVLKMGGEKVLILRRDEGSGKLIIDTLKLFDSDDKIIARIDENGFWVRPDTRKKWPDDSTLIVYDSADVEVLKLRFLNKDSVSLEGVFRHSDADTVKITPSETIVGNVTISKSITAIVTALSVGEPNITPH